MYTCGTLRIATMTDGHRVLLGVYLVLAPDGEVLLAQRKNTGFRDGDYGLVAGHVEPGESCEAAVVREAQEEANLTIAREDLEFVLVLHRDGNGGDRIEVFFRAEAWTGPIRNEEPGKCADLSWVPRDDLPENTIPYVEDVLAAVKAGDSYGEPGWQDPERPELGLGGQ
jgi:8-oxo-dGTP pyrophosphatase MutT (NUDIX family)